MKIGISSACFYPMDTVESLNECLKAGFDTAEIFVNTDSELQGGYFDGMKNFIRSNGMKIVSIHPYTSGFENILFFCGYEKRIVDGIEYYKKYFNCAAELGAKFVVFHGNNMRTKFCGFETYCSIFERINDTAKTFGVELLHENTTWSVAREPDGIKKLRETDPDMRFVFDAKQANRGGYSPYDVMEAMGDKIAHVHINDWADGQCRPPFAGELDLQRIIKNLDKINYKGDMVLEVYRENFGEASELSESAKRLKKELTPYFCIE